MMQYPVRPGATGSNERLLVALASTVAMLGGCHVGELEVAGSNDAPSYEEFLADTYREPGPDGVFIVNGDQPIANEKKLREFYDMLYGGDGALIAHAPGGAVAKWSAAQRRNLTYCVSNNFGARKAQTVDAMASAAAAWKAAADIEFIYLPAEDGNCVASNPNVVFDVRATQGQPYTARAFFPNDGRSTRNVLIDSSAFGDLGAVTLTGVLRHELGHALGFRHEHTRPEAGRCFEDSQYVELTGYDGASVMHYPQCNGLGFDLSLTALDVAGAQVMYGEPGDGGDPPPPPPPPPSGQQERQAQASGLLFQGEVVNYQPLSVVPGTRFLVVMSGVGDADLYVRFGAEPTRAEFDCRPFLSGSFEYCDLDVPAGESQAFISIDAYTSTSFSLTASWVEPL